MSRRIVVIGGDAAGMSAASGAKRGLGDEAEVIVFERTPDTSYSACGIPYWIGGEVDGRDALVVRSPEKHRANGIDVRTGHEVVAIDPAGARVRVRSGDAEEWHGYDDLVIATGAEPLRPPITGIDTPGVFGVQTLADGCAVIDALEGDDAPRSAVVVGSGYIGLEIAEAFVRRGLATTVVDMAEVPMRTLDPDMGTMILDAMRRIGIRTVMGAGVDEITARDGRVQAVRAGDEEIPADIVVLGLGVRARSRLAVDAGLPTGPGDAILTDRRMRVQGHERIWAGGDCVATHHRLLDRPVHVALGTHANKHGWIIGRNLTGDAAEFDGIVGTAITKICAREIARTGLGEEEAREAGLDAVSTTITTQTRAGYMPRVADIHVKMTAERGTRRILGAQIVGGDGSAARIDTVAAALWTGMTVDDLTLCDLGYSPPFSPVWDPVQTAARRLVGML